MTELQPSAFRGQLAKNASDWGGPLGRYGGPGPVSPLFNAGAGALNAPSPTSSSDERLTALAISSTGGLTASSFTFDKEEKETTNTNNPWYLFNVSIDCALDIDQTSHVPTRYQAHAVLQSSRQPCNPPNCIPRSLRRQKPSSIMEPRARAGKNVGKETFPAKDRKLPRVPAPRLI